MVTMTPFSYSDVTTYKSSVGSEVYIDYIHPRASASIIVLGSSHNPQTNQFKYVCSYVIRMDKLMQKIFLLTFCFQHLRYERRSPNATNSRTSASGSAVETQPAIWTTWQHSPEDTFFIMAISSRKFFTSRSSAPPVKCMGWEKGGDCMPES